MVRKKKKGAPDRAVMERIAKFFDTIAPDLVLRLTRAENEADKLTSRLGFIEEKLVGLLSNEQKEAARVCGMSSMDYALNLIELHKDKFFFEPVADYRKLHELKGGHFADWANKMTPDQQLEARKQFGPIGDSPRGD